MPVRNPHLLRVPQSFWRNRRGAARAFVTAAMAIGALCLGSLAGCSGLPTNVNRPISSALETPGSTPLGQLVQSQKRAQKAQHPSGFLMITSAQSAFSSRLALVQAAQKTLDLQYYAIHADESSRRLLLGVVAAAERGVRVRLLLDDFHSTGRDAQVMRLAFVPNIEMRMFNPLAGARGSSIGRTLSLLSDFDRLQQRMHNKLFIADNAMGIMGGRNLGDAYFGTAQAGNFVDLDVLAAGPIVQDLSRSFDSYWNNDRSYPVQSLVTREELDRLRASLRSSDDAKQGSNSGTPNAADSRSGKEANLPSQAPVVEASRPEQVPSTADRTATDDYAPMDLTRARFTWAPAAVLVDKPAKIPADLTTAESLPEQQPARATPLAITSGPGASKPDRVAGTNPPPPANAVIHLRKATEDQVSAPSAGSISPAHSVSASLDAETLDAKTDTVVDGLLQLMGQARRDLVIISPYFVPGPDMKQAFAAAKARGVRVRILTNSLASNDAPIAHAGYARHRPDLLAMGVELYEMRSDVVGQLRSSLSAGSAGASGSTGDSRAMLHSKVLIMDGRLIAVGSMNLDIRSQRQNTEIALLIRSVSLSRRAVSQIETTMKESAWHVQQVGGDLRWKAPEGSGLPDATTEPDASLPLRLMLQILGPLAPDHLL